jgi:hypothetical protein
VTMGLARRRRGPGAILTAMLTAQLGFHLLFSIDSHGMTSGPGPADGLHRMAMFHLVAAAVSTVILSTGERALFGLFAALSRSVRIPVPPAAVDLPPQWTARVVPLDSPRPEGPLLSTSPRRGPPAGHRRSVGPLALI